MHSEIEAFKTRTRVGLSQPPSEFLSEYNSCEETHTSEHSLPPMPYACVHVSMYAVYAVYGLYRSFTFQRQRTAVNECKYVNKFPL